MITYMNNMITNVEGRRFFVCRENEGEKLQCPIISLLLALLRQLNAFLKSSYIRWFVVMLWK